MRRFKEKTVVVTDAGCTIGQATALRFAKEGANVVLVGKTSEILDATAKLFPQDHTWIHTTNYLTITCDLSDQGQISAMIEHVVGKFGSIDVLVNNAGIALAGVTPNQTVSDQTQLSAATTNGSLAVCQALLPELVKAKGNIVNVVSLNSMDADWNLESYKAAIAKLNNLTINLALEYGSKGVRVNMVSPGITESEMSAAVWKDSEIAQWLQRGPLQRTATADEVAAAIVFLASEDAAMITAVDLPIDGGASAVRH